MKGIDIIAAALAIALVAGTVFYHVRRKMRGDGSCGYHCEGCKKHGDKRNGGGGRRNADR